LNHDSPRSLDKIFSKYIPGVEAAVMASKTPS
jgi:hypothetical protein